MTDKEIKLINFTSVSHMSMENEHIVCYNYESGRIGVCHHVPYKDVGQFRRAYTTYRIDDIIYKTKKEFLKALKEL